MVSRSVAIHEFVHETIRVKHQRLPRELLERYLLLDLGKVLVDVLIDALDTHLF